MAEGYRTVVSASAAYPTDRVADRELPLPSITREYRTSLGKDQNMKYDFYCTTVKSKIIVKLISWGLSVSIYEYAGMHVYDPMTVAHQAPLSMEL